MQILIIKIWIKHEKETRKKNMIKVVWKGLKEMPNYLLADWTLCPCGNNSWNLYFFIIKWSRLSLAWLFWKRFQNCCCVPFRKIKIVHQDVLSKAWQMCPKRAKFFSVTQKLFRVHFIFLLNDLLLSSSLLLSFSKLRIPFRQICNRLFSLPHLLLNYLSRNGMVLFCHTLNNTWV